MSCGVGRFKRGLYSKGLTLFPLRLLSSQWLGDMLVGESIPWEEVKLCLALKWQKAARERRDGGPGGYSDVLDTLVAGK